MKKKRRYRIYGRRILVDPFQMRIAGIAVFHYMLIVLVLAATVFAPALMELGIGSISSPEVQSAGREFLVLHTRLWVPLFCAFLLLILHNIVITHRIAGPLHRMRRYLAAVGDGDLSSPIRFRKNDYLKDDAAAASRMVESLRAKISQVDERLDQANAAWMILKTSLADEIADELKEKIDAMDERIEGCKAGVAAFKTGNERIPAVPRPKESSEKPVELRV